MTIQANWHLNRLHVWSHPQPTDADALRAAIGELCADALLPAAGHDATIDLWIPANGQFTPQAITTLAFGPADAIDLLVSLPASLPDCGDSIAYWRRLAKLVVDLLSRQQFHPDLRPRESWLEGTWKLAVRTPQLIDRLERFANAMPPVCRAMVNGPIDPRRLVESFLEESADAVIRRDVALDPFFSRVHEKAAEPDAPAEIKWLSGLLGRDPAIRAEADELLVLAERVRGWLAKLEPAGAAAPPRLCFRLDEPDEPAEDDAQASDPSADSVDRQWRLELLLELPENDNELIEADELFTRDVIPDGILGKTVLERRARLLAELSRAAEIVPPLERLAASPAPSELMLNTAEAGLFIRQWAPALSQAGFGVFLPDWVTHRDEGLGVLLSLRPTEGDEQPGQSGPASGGVGLGALLDFDWQVAVGDMRLSPQQFEALSRSGSSLVKFAGRWVQVDPDAAGRAAEFMRTRRSGKMTLAEALRAAFTASTSDVGLPVLGVKGTGWLEQFLEQLPGRRVEQLPQPPSFNGTLRPYQLRGMDWLAFLESLGLGACLADDMGLGKTIQLIALMLNERQNGAAPGPTLLFCPTSVVSNWSREVDRFGPTLRALVHHGSERTRGATFEKLAMDHDLVITTYALAHRDVEDLRRPAWHRITLDEAQKIKNPYAASTLAIRTLVAPHRVALTGTPLENHLSELWSIMEMLNPGLLGSASEFRERFAVPVEKLGDRDRAVHLRNMVRPFMLRRTKSDPLIAGDLPEKMEMRVFCNLTPEQATLYQRITEQLLGEVEDAAGIRRRGLILAGLTRLKQVCDHPELLPILNPEPRTPKPPLDGRSGKCERLAEMLEEVIEEGDAALVFTQYKQMGDLLERFLAARLSAPILFLHGGTPPKQRQALIDRFQKPGSDARIFILSLRAGGLGLNLTAANHVFHFDRWWNPAVESQATDRAHRIGQTRKVQVHKFVCVGTMEERIDKMLSDKVALADRIVGSGDEWLTNLSTDELRETLALSREAVGEF